jgi:Ca2+/Na+ antiporter
MKKPIAFVKWMGNCFILPVIVSITASIATPFILDKIKDVAPGTHIKSFFSAVFRFMTKTFTIPVIIPIWLIFLVFIGIVFFVLWYIFWKKICIEVVRENALWKGEDHIAGTDTVVFCIPKKDKKEADRLVKLGVARIVK